MAFPVVPGHRTRLPRRRAHRHFRNLRFDWVKRRLEYAGPRESVSSIAMDCGFLQLGRFSRDYQKRFGERPSQAIGRCAGQGEIQIVRH